MEAESLRVKLGHTQKLLLQEEARAEAVARRAAELEDALIRKVPSAVGGWVDGWVSGWVGGWVWS